MVFAGRRGAGAARAVGWLAALLQCRRARSRCGRKVGGGLAANALTTADFSAFVAASDLLDQIDDAAPQFRIFDPHKRFGQSKTVSGCQEVGNVCRRRRLGETFVPAHGLSTGCTLKEERDRHLKNVRNLLKTTGADPVGAF